MATITLEMADGNVLFRQNESLLFEIVKRAEQHAYIVTSIKFLLFFSFRKISNTCLKTHFDHSAIVDMCVGVYRVSSLNFLDQVNSGSVAGDLETGTPVPQEVPENVQVLKRLLLGSSECVFLTYRYFLYVYSSHLFIPLE